ncbi:MAG: hypothetical protein AB7I37_22845 [Pirellulales bacterium]
MAYSPARFFFTKTSQLDCRSTDNGQGFMRHRHPRPASQVWPAFAAWGAFVLVAGGGCSNFNANMAQARKARIEAELAVLDEELAADTAQANAPPAPRRAVTPKTRVETAGDSIANKPVTELQPLVEVPRLDPVPTDETVARSPELSPQSEQDFDAVIAELQSLGAIDPLARQRLVEDLKRTSPELWPPLIQYFRASLAERRGTPDTTPQPQRERLPLDAAPPAQAQADNLPATTPRDSGPQFDEPRRLPGLADDSSDNRDIATTTNKAVSVDDRPRPLGEAAADKQATATLASHTAELPTARPAAVDWQERLKESIAALESELRERQLAPDQDVRPAQLRFLYLIAGRREEAIRPAGDWTGVQQQFLSEEIFGLSTFLDSDRIPDPSRRSAEASRQLSEAAVSLGETASLVVRNLAFCTEIKDFGLITRFDQSEFKPGDKVLLYAEVENFKSLPTPRGHHTSLTASYQVFDSEGRRVEEHDFPPTEEHCQSRRRDFFMPFVITLPAQAYDGRHTLRLTIEDTLGNKIGQASIDFTIRGKRQDAAIK